MKYSSIYLSILALASLFSMGCEYDNFEAPKSTLSGTIVYEGNPVSVRTGGTRLQLWEDGHELRTPMDVFIDHEGHFSASLFDGTYKLVTNGDAPWSPRNLDTVEVTVRGNTVVDIPVTPYFVLENESFTAAGTTLNAQFAIRRVVPNANVSRVALYVGHSILTDQGRFEHRVEMDAGNIQVGQPLSMSTTLPASLANLDYVFVRVGVLSNLSGEYYYSDVQRVNLP